MANNIDILDGAGATKTVKTTDNASVHTPHHNVDTLATITNVVHVDDNSSTLSVDDGAGSLTVDYATTGSGNATGALRVEIANNGTGVIATVGTITNAVTVNSHAVTVASGGVASGAIASGALASGSVASGAVASGAFASGSISDGASVTLGAKADAKSTATDTTAITAMQVLKQISASVQAPPSQAVTNAGTFAVQVDGSALTSLQLIDDVVYTDDTSTHATGTSKGALLMAAATPTDTSVDANDIGAVAMTTDRQLNVRATVASAGIASGAIASGAVASGAFASGSIGSGAIASGAIASGAIASGAIASGAIAVGAIAAGATSIADNEDAASNDGDRGVKILAVQKATPANTGGSDGDYEFLQLSAGKLWVKHIGDFVTVSTDVTRQAADTTTYAANDTISDSTSAPTSGGFTFTNAGRISGGSGIITDAIISSSAVPALLLQGEIWLFDTSVTNPNDNVAFVISDGEAKTYVGKIPFALESAGANNSVAHIVGLNIGFTCVGSANLRFLLRAKNAYIPVGSEVLTFRLKIQQTN